MSFQQKGRRQQKEKKKQKKKNVLKYGKLKEFSTFQHDKQTTIVFFIFEKSVKLLQD